MVKTNWIICILAILGSLGCVNTPQNNEFDILADKVAALNISYQQYSLGKKLTEDQKKLAKQNAAKDASPGTYKFNDASLFVVAEKNSDRVMILYEHFEKTLKTKGSELIGSLMLEFGDPTVFAHGKTVYWVYNADGKISKEKFNKAKNDANQLEVLATVKLESSELLMGNAGDKETPKQGNKEHDQSIYYVISSEPLLKLFKAKAN